MLPYHLLVLVGELLICPLQLIIFLLQICMSCQYLIHLSLQRYQSRFSLLSSPSIGSFFFAVLTFASSSSYRLCARPQPFASFLVFVFLPFAFPLPFVFGSLLVFVVASSSLCFCLMLLPCRAAFGSTAVASRCLLLLLLNFFRRCGRFFFANF